MLTPTGLRTRMMFLQLALVVSAALASSEAATLAVPVEKFGRNDRNDELKTVNAGVGRNDRNDEPKTVNTGVGESYTCWEGVDMEGTELGDMTFLDGRETWAECKKRCSARGNCLGVVFKNGAGNRQGCQEYSSIRKWKRPGFSGPSTACIKMELPNIRPFSLVHEPAAHAAPHGPRQLISSSGLFVAAGLLVAALVAGFAVRRKRHQATVLATEDFVAGGAIA